MIREHTIRELPTGWLHKEWGTTYRTLAAAVRAVDVYERGIVAGGIVRQVTSVRTYEPTTDVGRSVVLAVTGAEEVAS